jgi:poly-beta-1,6-N-acetyl-D-glucosamine synthase
VNSDLIPASYVLISPVKDEGAYIEKTIDAVVGQSVRPIQWIIVDDASQDRTAEILQECQRRVPWIKVIRLEGGSKRQPGSRVISAFNAGLALVADLKFDFIVKLDCDLCIPSNYFERLIERFKADSNLGIASGIYLEQESGNWRPVNMPVYHAAGAAKMVRAECFRQIGGFVPTRGWDTVDEIKAQFKGWKTLHFRDLQFYHLKNEGSGIGSTRTNQMHGEIYYVTGGGTLFLLLKVLHRCLFGDPPFFAGISMLRGYVRAWFGRRPLLVSDEEGVFYRRLLNQRILNGVSALLRWNTAKRKARLVS